jgi:mannan endo-1,4-beta-mannosidase
MAINLSAQNFVEVRGTHFYREGTPYYFLGTNFWYGMNLASVGPGGNRTRLLAELDQLQSLCVTNLRIIAGSEGPDDASWRVSPSLQPQPGQYNQDLLEGLDFLLVEMGKRNMTAVICLNNFWPWSGGFAQYHHWFSGDVIPYPPPAEGGSWFKYARFSSRFYKNKAALAAFDQHISKIVSRVNSVNGLAYKNDPTIMSWQLANEPRGIFRPRAYRRWIKRAASLIKSIDLNHLVSIGSEGNTNAPTGNHFSRDHTSKLIDYTTIHIWIQNWGWYDPQQATVTYDLSLQKAKNYISTHLAKAEKLNKPVVLEEFGIARDLDDHDPIAATLYRDRYYQDIFEYIHQLAKNGTAAAACNFWAWGGQGRPRAPKVIWQIGDPLIGDPPHEYQGWYSVYDRDTSTLGVIKEFGEKMILLGVRDEE